MISWELFFKWIDPFDQAVHAALTPDTRESFRVAFFERVTHLGDVPMLLLILGLVSAILLYTHRHQTKRRSAYALIIWMTTGFFVNAALVSAIKAWTARPRPIPYTPIEVSNLSFPSGHSAEALMFAILLSTVGQYVIASQTVRRVLTMSSLSVALLIAMSRLMIGIHWTSDVFAGLFLAMGMAYLWRRFLPKPSLT